MAPKIKLGKFEGRLGHEDRLAEIFVDGVHVGEIQAIPLETNGSARYVTAVVRGYWILADPDEMIAKLNRTQYATRGDAMSAIRNELKKGAIS